MLTDAKTSLARVWLARLCKNYFSTRYIGKLLKALASGNSCELKEIYNFINKDNVHMHIYTHAHTLKHTQTQIHIHKHTHAHAHTQTHTHMHTHTHTNKSATLILIYL